MKLLLIVAALLNLLLSPVLTDEESCVGRCDEGFNSQKKCQCEPKCIYFDSCCFDFSTVCNPKVTRGDVFILPDDDYLIYNDTFIYNDTALISPVEPETQTQETEELVPTELPFEEHTESETEIEDIEPTISVFNEEEEGDEEEELCSGKPFDAFTDLKNGSIYAFRGKYFYELDDKGVQPGFPKLIKDAWGIEGPVDAAFTRINCQGRTYLFKGSEYWRFDNGVLDPGYPRNISKGFKNIPDHLDASFALPAHNSKSKERVYFFKGSRYWQYHFKHQPSRKDCESETPSIIFDQYAFLQLDSLYTLFGDLMSDGESKPRLISRDWKGLPNGINAAVAGRIYLPPQNQKVLRRSWRRKSRRNRKRYQRKRFPSWSRIWTWQSEEDDDPDFDPDWSISIMPQCHLVQSAYFFKKDKYYRVNLKTKRVDFVQPRYPRSIAHYWLDCKHTERRKK
uniref:Vitronectin n=1 Tax=Geotrypetes seraphini TaxID=260995 RepID=A0A6P8PST5_GEOSA|nr:vitronectin [Geotrypetes seraphini]